MGISRQRKFGSVLFGCCEGSFWGWFCIVKFWVLVFDCGVLGGLSPCWYVF